MSIALIVGEPVKVDKNPVDMFELEVKYMSGDADAYETETYKFKSLEDREDEDDNWTLKNALMILLAYDKATGTRWNDLCGISDTLDKAKLCEEFREMLDIHHSGFAVVNAGTVHSIVGNLEDDSNLMELIRGLARKILGSSESYSFRVYDGHRAYFIKEEIKPHVFPSFFKLES
jgi:hypothetical protein